MTPGRIVRDPDAASREDYDLIVVGGGVYGIMTTLEAVRRGLKPLLLERDDFGEHTSFNHLRIVHGGLRYLQTLDLHRFRESVAERRWFLRTFPGRVRPLPCLMPLYGDGLRRPEIMAVALGLNDLLSMRRNRGVPEAERLPRGRLLSAEETRARFPEVNPVGLRGAALWYDAIMPDSHRILIDSLRRACGGGATALNYMEAKTPMIEAERISGVVAEDRESGSTVRFRSPVVVNAAGPWCRELAGAWDRALPELFRPSLAWNVLFDRKPFSDHALAVAPRNPGGHTYFLVPWKGRLFAGTGHVPWSGSVTPRPMPTTDRQRAFLDDLNRAIPNANLTEDDVLRVFSGLLPAAEAGTATLSVREVFRDHGASGGPAGLWSVSGVKFTTARRVAAKLLDRVFPAKTPPPWNDPLPESLSAADIARLGGSAPGGDGVPSAIRRIVEEESVRRREDLVLRRIGGFEEDSGGVEFLDPGSIRNAAETLLDGEREPVYPRA